MSGTFGDPMATGDPAPPTGDPERGGWPVTASDPMEIARGIRERMRREPAPPTGDTEQTEVHVSTEPIDKDTADMIRRATSYSGEGVILPPTGDRGERPEDVLRDFLLWFYAEDHTRTDLDDPLAALDALVAERDRHKANAEDYHLALKARDRALAAERVRADRLAVLVKQAAGFLRNGSGYREQIAGWLMDAREATASDPEGGSPDGA